MAVYVLLLCLGMLSHFWACCFVCWALHILHNWITGDSSADVAHEQTNVIVLAYTQTMIEPKKNAYLCSQCICLMLRISIDYSCARARSWLSVTAIHLGHQCRFVNLSLSHDSLNLSMQLFVVSLSPVSHLIYFLTCVLLWAPKTQMHPVYLYSHNICNTVFFLCASIASNLSPSMSQSLQRIGQSVFVSISHA